MKRLLVSTLLLNGCLLQPAVAQKAPLKKPIHKATTRSVKMPTGVPNWVATEFCDAYTRNYLELPYAYKIYSSQALKNTVLGRIEVNMEGELAKSADLREKAYKTLYDYCLSINGSTNRVDEMLYLMLYRQVRMTSVGATVLNMHIISRYNHPNSHSSPTSVIRQSLSTGRPQEPELNSGEENDTDAYEGSTKTEEPAEQKVYTYVEQMPRLPSGGGNAAIVAAIQKVAKYTPLALRNQVEGRIFVSFTVNPQGDVSDVKVVKGLGSGLDEETIRAVKTLPKFMPGKQNGRAVSVSFTVPIDYKMEAMQNATARP